MDNSRNRRIWRSLVKASSLTWCRRKIWLQTECRGTLMCRVRFQVCRKRNLKFSSIDFILVFLQKIVRNDSAGNDNYFLAKQRKRWMKRNEIVLASALTFCWLERGNRFGSEVSVLSYRQVALNSKNTPICWSFWEVKSVDDTMTSGFLFLYNYVGLKWHPLRSFSKD